MASNANKIGGPRVLWRMIGWAVPAVLLTIPWIAHFPWTASDYVVAAAMFAVVGGTFELAVRASGSASYRAGAAVALGTAFLTTWVNLAVGIIGNENNPLNLIFFAVIAAALVGAIVARFEAAGMARAMSVAAALQAIVGIAVAAFNIASNEPPGTIGLFILIELFACAWLGSAWFFRKAARPS